MKKLAHILVGLLTINLCFSPSITTGFCSPQQIHASTTVSLSLEMNYGQTEARAMLARINELRTGENAWYWNQSNTKKINVDNLEPLQYDYDLEKVAMQRAAELAVAYGHLRPNGMDCFTAYDECNYYTDACGENIAAGQSTERNVYICWEEADEDYAGQGHRRNMLSAHFASVGIGHVVYKGRHFWVQEFSSYVSSDEETTAIDEEKSVSVEVDSSFITLYNVASAKISLTCGSALPIANCKLNMVVQGSDGLTSCKTFQNSVLPVTQAAITSNGVITCDGTTVKGIEAGDTTLDVLLFGHTFSIPVTVSHQPAMLKNQANATCTKDGYTGDSYCLGCEQLLEKGSTLPASGHVIVIDHAKEATTFSKGLTEGSHCSVCGEVLKAQQELPMLSPTKVATSSQPNNTPGGNGSLQPSNTTIPYPTIKPNTTKAPNSSLAPNMTPTNLTASPTAKASGTDTSNQKTSETNTSTTKPSSTKAPESGTSNNVSNTNTAKKAGQITLPAKWKKIVTFHKKNLKKNSLTISISAKGTSPLSYKLKKGKKSNISVSKKGLITLKQGCKAGTYKILIETKETDVYESASQVITLKVK